MDYLLNIKSVCDLLQARGFDANVEYPGYIYVNGWSFGTVDSVWGGDYGYDLRIICDETVRSVTSSIEPEDTYVAAQFIESTLAIDAMIESLDLFINN